jgi:uncharacterized protein YcfL
VKRFLSLFVLAAGLLAGCASTTGSTSTSSPQQIVFAAKSGYATALTAAVAYKRLPACATPAVLPCSDQTIVAQMQKADNVAAASLDAAESAVRTPAVSASARDRAIAAANAALAAMNALVISIGVQP